MFSLFKNRNKRLLDEHKMRIDFASKAFLLQYYWDKLTPKQKKEFWNSFTSVSDISDIFKDCVSVSKVPKIK